MTPDWHQIRKVYDGLAADYDDLFAASETGQWIRQQVQEELLKTFAPNSYLLELNAGTGTDAVFLAQRGYRIMATDFSEGMLDVARHKIILHGLEDKITTRVLPFDQLSLLQGNAFDGVYSIFNGMNALRDLSALARDLSSLVKPHGFLVIHFLNKFSIWDTVYYLYKLSPKQAFAKFSPEGALVNRGSMKHFFFSERGVKRTLARFHFCHKKTIGFSFLALPTFLELGKRVTRVLRKVETPLRSMYPVRSFGEHLLMTFQNVKRET
jgi:ubiquinone/menaquinone biosynthesis C-methylase UbiE